MSKTLTKILTICGLCVVVVAAVIASAVCATAAIGYNVTVDVVKLLNEDFNSPDGNVKIKINGEETNELLVKKGDEAIITFEATDFDFQGFYNGDENSYVGTQPVEDGNGSLVEIVKFVVNEETNFTAVFKAQKYFKMTLARAGTIEDTERSVSLGVKGASVYPDEQTPNTYWVKEGVDVELTHSEYGYKFNKWYVGNVADNTEKNPEFKVEENNKTYTASFSVINKYTVTIASAYDASADGGNISAVANGDKTSITVWDGEKIKLSTSATGYNFVNWKVNGTVIGETAVIEEYTVGGNVTITANYKVIRYNISYDGAEAVSTVWGSALRSPAPTYDASTGWKVFTGWKFNENTVEKAVFNGTDTNISLTGDYNFQSATTYTFATADKTITYKTVAENRLDLTNASKNYYTLVGIRFNINNTDFVFDIAGNDLVAVEGGKTLEQLDTALRDANVATIAATPIYKLNFGIKFTITSAKGSGLTADTAEFEKGLTDDIANIKLLGGVAIRDSGDYSNITEISGYDFTFQSGLADKTVMSVLEALREARIIEETNTTDLTIAIYFG